LSFRDLHCSAFQGIRPQCRLRPRVVIAPSASPAVARPGRNPASHWSRVPRRRVQSRGSKLKGCGVPTRTVRKAGCSGLTTKFRRKYGYPPDKQEKATQTVLEQAEVLSQEWAVARGPGRAFITLTRVH